MGTFYRSALMVLFALISGCVTDIDSTNPYDPDTPEDMQAEATLSGIVSLEGLGNVEEVSIEIVSLISQGQSFHPAADGSYVISVVPPDIQEVVFSLEGYEDRLEARFFEPGGSHTLDVRLITLRGDLRGKVRLEDQSNHSGITIVIQPKEESSFDFQIVSQTAPSGDYILGSIPVGTYSLTASKTKYQGKTISEVIVEANSVTTAVTLELPPVTGAVMVYGGDGGDPQNFDNPDYPACCPNTKYTRTRHVKLHIFGLNTAAMQFHMSDDRIGLESQPWAEFNDDPIFELSAENGDKVVYVQLKDENDVLSDVFEGHTVLDTQVPELVTMILGNGSGYSKETTIAVRFTAEDLPMESAIAEMRIRLGQEPDAQDGWTPYQFRTNLTLDDLDSEQTIFVQVRDRAGNLSEIHSETVRLDRNPPTAGPVELGPPVKVANGSGYALSLDVPITFNVVDDITPQEDLRVKLCEVEGCPGVAYSPYSAQIVRSYASEGAHTIYVVFKDGAGNTFEAQPVDFTIDAQGPTFPVAHIAEGSHVGDQNIHVVIDVDGADQMMISEDPFFADAIWEDFASPKAFILEDVEEEHTVFVMVRDLAGHVSGPAAARVYLDKTAPDGSLLLQIHDPDNQCVVDDCYTNSESALVLVTASDNLSDVSALKMQFSLTGESSDFGPIQAYSANTLVLLENTSEPQRIYLRLIDAAGNASLPTQIPADKRAILDLVSPTLPSVVTNHPTGYGNTTGLVIDLDSVSTDNSGELRGYEYQIEPAPSWWPEAPWIPFDYPGPVSVDLDACSVSSCSYKIKVRAVDRAGNVGDASVKDLVLDSDAPVTPGASITPVSDLDSPDPGPKVVNAEAVTVWVKPEDSQGDPNFDQFQVRLQTCEAGFDPLSFSCTSWNAWTSWSDTGVGKGGFQIPVILLSENLTNHIQVRSRDLAQNLSSERSVYYTEDSTPPSPAIMYPDDSEINASAVSISIKTPAQDTNGLSGYECTINGEYKCQPFIDGEFKSDQTSNQMPASITQFKVELNQNETNTIHLRGIDNAGNRSGTSLASVVENSTPIMLTEYPAQQAMGVPDDLRIERIETTAFEQMLSVTQFEGKKLDTGDDVKGVLVYDLRTDQMDWFRTEYNSQVRMKGYRMVISLPLGTVCNEWTDLVDANYGRQELCDCHNSAVACPYAPNVTDAIMDGSTSTLVLIDYTYGVPIRQWVTLPSGYLDSSLQQPLLRPMDGDLLAFDFDGLKVAWLEGPQIWSDECHIYSASLDGTCDTTSAECLFSVLGHKESNTPAEQCGLVAVGGEHVAWGVIDGGQISLSIHDGSTKTELETTSIKNGLDKQAIDFDCVWDSLLGAPVCENLFWFSGETFQLALKSYDLLNHTIDKLKDGLIEMRDVDAEKGRAVFQDSLAGTADIFLVDLNDPDICTGAPGARVCNAKAIVGGGTEDRNASILDHQVTYWREAGTNGLQMHLLDMSSQPWIFAREGLQALPRINNEKMLYAWIEPGGSKPYRLEVYDPANGSHTNVVQSENMILPAGFRSEVGGGYRIGFLQLEGGSFRLSYCDDESVFCTSPRDLLQASVTGVGTGFSRLVHARGNGERIVWKQSTDLGVEALLSCSLSSATGRCEIAGEFNILAYVLPAGDASICDISFNNNKALLSLEDRIVSDRVAIYQVDIGQLESNGIPVKIDSTVVPLVKGFERHIGTYDNHFDCGDVDDRLGAGDPLSDRVAIFVSEPACVKCVADNLSTLFINEACTSAPCCEKAPCVCDPADSCNDYRDFTQLVLADTDVQTIGGWFLDRRPQDVELYGDWLAWVERKNGLREIVVLNMASGQERRLTFDFFDQQFVTLGWLPGNGIIESGTHLVWVDSRLGALQLFHTRLGD